MLQNKIFIFYTILAAGLVYFSVDIYLPAFPVMVHFFGVDITALQATLSIYFLGVVIAQFLTGPIIDYFGYRSLAIGSTIFFILSCLLCALSHHLLSLVIFRFFQALSAGSVTLIARASLPRLFTKEEVAKLYLIISPGLALSPAIAPVVGGHILALFNWQMIFVFLSLLGVLILILTWKFQKIEEVENVKTSIYPKYILKTYISFLKNKEYVGLLFILSSTFFVYFAFLAESPFLLHKFGYSEVQIGYCYISFSLAFVIATQIKRFFLKNSTIKQTITIGMLINLASTFLLFIITIWGKQGPLWLLMPMTIFCFGNAFTNTTAIASASSMSENHSGYATSLASSVMLLSSGVASNIIQPITHGSILGLASIVFMMLIIAFLFYLKLTR